MATTSTSTVVAAVEPVFTEPERRALAGFLAGYTGLTREAYALDLGRACRVGGQYGEVCSKTWPIWAILDNDLVWRRFAGPPG
jgi:hypothetical protein